MSLRVRPYLLALLPVFLRTTPHSLACQAQQQPQAEIIRVSTSLVQVPVSVTDTDGHAVTDLQLEDFTIQENGSPVTIAHFGEAGETRLEMVLVFDNTGSVFMHFAFDQQAAADFLKTIFRPHDGVAILCIESRPEVLLDRTMSLPDALKSLSQLQPSLGATAFYDSVIAAAHLFHPPTDPEARRVQIVLSDGEDNLSDQHLDDAIREVQQADCVFYSINPGGPNVRFNLISQRGQQAMEALADQTGGVAFLVDKKEALGEIYGRIAAELKAQYLLSYYSPDTRMDGSYRRIGVGVPKRPELRVRARQGYYATKGSSR